MIIKGADGSVATIPESTPSTTLTVDNVTANPTDETSTGVENLYYGYIHASSVQYYLAKLLSNTLSQVDASIPNKEQNKAMKHLLRKQFDSTLLAIHEMAWPLTKADLNAMKQRQVAGTSLENGYVLQLD